MNKLLALLFCTFIISASARFASFKENFTGDSREDHGEDGGEHYQSGSWSIDNYSDGGESEDYGEYYANIYLYDNGEYRVSGTYQRNTYNIKYFNGKYQSEELHDSGEYNQGGYISFDGNSLPKDLGLPKFIKKQRKQSE